MSTISLKGASVSTIGEIPKAGKKAKDFSLVKTDLSKSILADYAGTKLVLNIFPSVDTGTCAKSMREFNRIASNLPNTKVVCISRDLPFAFKRFCAAEGLENVIVSPILQLDLSVKITDLKLRVAVYQIYTHVL